MKCGCFAPPLLTLQMFYLQEEMGLLYTLILKINMWYLWILKVIWSLFNNKILDINMYWRSLNDQNSSH